MIDVLIIGSGVGGLSAGLYAGRYGLDTLIVGKMLGGATSKAWTVENYPGYMSIDGYDLITKMKEQVEALGVEIKTDKVIKIEKTGDTFRATTEEGDVIESKTIILTAGAERRKLGLDKEEEFAKGKGIHYCLTCDGPMYKGKTIAVIGGGDSAVKGLTLAVQYASKIYVVDMIKELKAEKINLDRIQPHIGKEIELKLGTKVETLLGEDRLTGIKLANGEELQIDGLFVEIGAVSDKNLPDQLEIEVDDEDYIKVNNMMETNVLGVYAAGDVTNFFGHFKQIVTASAMGTVAATTAFNYIKKSR